MNVYQPEQWRDFFILVGTGAVTLTGLVFVAMSVNVAAIAGDITHRYRAIGTLTGLAAVFLRCALALMGGQNHQLVGAELLIIAAFAGFVYVSGYLRASKISNGPSLQRTVSGTALYMVEIIGAAMFMLGSIAGLYIAAAAMVINCCFMISGAWLLVMGVVPRDR